MSDPTLETLRKLLQTGLSDFFSSGKLSFAQEELETYGKDWTKTFPPRPLALAFPRSTEEVAQITRFCFENAIPIVPSGGRTGLAGGAVAANGELILSLEKMNRMDPVDTLSHTLRVQAGAITEAVHHHCEPFHLTWPIDFASKGSSQVGGNIATNAGGVNVIRYGLTRNWVLGLQVVTGTGEILELNGALEKNNTGIDLRQLFIGSEGTLGIITEATLKLAPLAHEKTVCLFTLPNLDSVLGLFRFVRSSEGIPLQAFETFSQACLRRVRAHRGLRSPFQKESPHYVLLEVETPTASGMLESWLEKLFSSGWVNDGAMAQNTRESEEFWALREGISESLAATGVLHKNDIALPIANLEPFCAELESFFSSHYPGWEICVFGHIGDGNLHINVMKPESMETDDFRTATAKVDTDLFSLVHKHQGSISAEHGIGLLKKPFLGFSRTAEEIRLFREIKRVFDPAGILNPGKIWD